MCYTGLGVAKDLAEAARLFRLAADQGNANAQFNLGVMYENGEGVAKDLGEAMRLFRLAADENDADA
jgi:TPR repeat protein